MSQINVETEMAPTIRPLARLCATAFSAEWMDPERGLFQSIYTFGGTIHSTADGAGDYDPV